MCAEEEGPELTSESGAHPEERRRRPRKDLTGGGERRSGHPAGKAPPVTHG